MKKIFILVLICFSCPVLAEDEIISVTCESEYFLPANFTDCVACPSGYTCIGGTYEFDAVNFQGIVRNEEYITGTENNVCSSNFGQKIYALYNPITYTCASGYFLPANTTGCVACPSGYTCSGGSYAFDPKKSQGLVQNGNYITGTENNVCSSNFGQKIYALYNPITYTCASGYFLPANTMGCVACPSGYTCSGGSYAFNPKKSQGLVRNENYISDTESNVCSSNFGYKLYALYEPIKYDCMEGEYLPANSSECTLCPSNNYCYGGQYPLNETDDQGIVSCPYSLLAPMGMWKSEQCGHKLHVGDNSVYLRSAKKTTPSLNIMVDNDVFYGNMTTADVPMNINTTHKLKVKIGDTVYSVYDDTITP